METDLEKLREGREKSAETIITIDGVSGAGKGVLSEQVSEITGLKTLSAGEVFRGIAEERGMDVVELSENAGKEVDVEVDTRILEEALEKSCVVESRIASHVIGEFADFSIFLDADMEERAERVASRENISVEEARERIKKRDESDRERYQEYYGIDFSKRDHYDLIVDNTDLGIDEQYRLVKKALGRAFPELVE